MADTKTGGNAEQNGNPTEGNEGSPESTSTGADSQQHGGDGGDEGEEGDDDEGDDSGESDEDDEDKEPEDDGAEPPVRDSSYYIGLRHGKKAAKAATKTGKESKNGNDGGNDDDSGDDDEEGSDIHPDDAAILEGAVKKAVAPLTEALQKQENEKELGNFLSSNPAFKPFEKKIRRFMEHPSRAQLPVSTIAMEAVGPEGMIKLGARMARQADTKKQTSKGGGNSQRQSQGGRKNAWELPKGDFAAMQEEVRRKAR